MHAAGKLHGGVQHLKGRSRAKRMCSCSTMMRACFAGTMQPWQRETEALHVGQRAEQYDCAACVRDAIKA